MDQSELDSNVESLTKKKKQKNKDSIDKSEFKINMDPWGMSFMILFVAILGYLIIGAMASLPPFVYNLVTEEYDIRDGLLTALIVIALICLALGIYFGWIKKPKVEEKEEVNGNQEDKELTEDDAEKTDRQITFVYVDDKKTEE